MPSPPGQNLVHEHEFGRDMSSYGIEYSRRITPLPGAVSLCRSATREAGRCRPRDRDYFTAGNSTYSILHDLTEELDVVHVDATIGAAGCRRLRIAAKCSQNRSGSMTLPK